MPHCLHSDKNHRVISQSTMTKETRRCVGKTYMRTFAFHGQVPGGVCEIILRIFAAQQMFRVWSMACMHRLGSVSRLQTARQCSAAVHGTNERTRVLPSPRWLVERRKAVAKNNSPYPSRTRSHGFHHRLLREALPPCWRGDAAQRGVVECPGQRKGPKTNSR